MDDTHQWFLHCQLYNYTITFWTKKEAFIDKSHFMKVPNIKCHGSCVCPWCSVSCSPASHLSDLCMQIGFSSFLVTIFQLWSPDPQYSHKFEIPALVKMKCTMWRDWPESFHLLTCIEFLERPMGISTTKESLNMINTTLLGRNWSTFSHLLHLMNSG